MQGEIALPFYLFTWTDDIIAHLAEHGVTPEEFQQVVCAPDEVDTSRTSGRPVAFGETEEGRFLACVYELIDPTTVLPVTAFEPEAH
jgi:uncharacterized DUF497 family protein